MSTMPMTWRTLAATAALLALTVHGTRGQTAVNPLPVTTLPQGNLNLDEIGTQPKGYAFLMQVMPEGRTPYTYVNLRAEATVGPPETWNWKVISTDNELRWRLNMKWYAQAACPDALTNLQVVGPAGTLTQNPLHNPIWGYFSTQSFTIETVKDICEEWANANKCDPKDPGTGCPIYEDFNLVGGVAPASNADRLRLKASCVGGPVADTYYGPKLRIRCDREPY